MKRCLAISLYFIFTLLPGLLCGQGSGNVLSYNGTNQYIDLGSQVANNCRTVECWFKLAEDVDQSLSDVVTLVGRDYANSNGLNANEFCLYFSPVGWTSGRNGTLCFYRRIGGTFCAIFSDNNHWQAGAWYHVAAVIDPSAGMQLYINGVLQQDTHPSTQPIQPQTGSASDILTIATWGYWGAHAGQRFFKGELDELRFWTTTRTQTDVRENMCRKINPVQSGLQGYYRFDQSNSSVLNDLTGHGYNGALQHISTSAWRYSSAPIGDTSTYVYPASWSGQILNLTANAHDRFLISDITGASAGAHIYRVNSLPNSTQGLSAGSAGFYHGVFLTGLSGSYTIEQDYGAYVPDCDSGCVGMYSRNDNAVMNWHIVNGLTGTSCLLKKQLESQVGDPFRDEYIVSNVPLKAGTVSSLSICGSQQTQLSAPASSSSYTWSTGETTASITVSEPGVYWLEVSNGTCAHTDTFHIELSDSGTVSTLSLCENQQTQLSAPISSSSYTWSTGETTASITVSEPGVYWLETDNNTCIYTDTFHVELLSSGTINTLSICGSQQTQLSALASSSSYTWSTGETTASITVSEPGVYWLETFDSACIHTDTFHVELSGSGAFIIPNVFTPNGDRVNDTFRIQVGCGRLTDAYIYNRWGTLVYRYSIQTEGWDGNTHGKPCSNGTYFVIVYYEEPGQSAKKYSGFTELFR